jgi:hypothetical protein
MAWRASSMKASRNGVWEMRIMSGPYAARGVLSAAFRPGFDLGGGGAVGGFTRVQDGYQMRRAY